MSILRTGDEIEVITLCDAEGNETTIGQDKNPVTVLNTWSECPTAQELVDAIEFPEYDDTCIIPKAVSEPIISSSGVLSDGTTYTVTNSTGAPTLFDSANDGDIRWENTSTIRFVFSKPVNFYATPTDQGDVGNPIVWQSQNGGASRLLSDGDPVIYTPGSFDALLNTSTNPQQARATTSNSNSPTTAEDWGSVFAASATTIDVSGRDAEAMRFTAVCLESTSICDAITSIMTEPICPEHLSLIHI